jgi:hypothetical protein
MPRGYQSFDHGYATTIHKTQGATVDRAFVLASQTMDRHLTYVSMTRHRDRVQLYAGRDAFRDNRDLAATLGRSGAKETTLDYLGSFTERRGMAVGFGIDSEIDLEPGPKPGQRRTARDEPHIVRVHQDPPAVRSADAERRKRAGPEGNEHSVEKPPPLLPAVQRYDRSIEDVARDKAMPTFDRQWQDVEMVARMAFNNPIAIVASLRLAIIEQSADAERLAKALAERPEHFGSLRGRTGMFGDNRERKEARRLARAVASHVASAGATWQRCLSEERGAEQWRRDKRDVVEVPDLTPRSAALLHQLVQTTVAERSRFIEQLGGTAEGRKALDEARQITAAFERRFGRSDPRDHHLRHEFERLGPELAGKLDRIKSVARLVDRAHRAELSQQLEPKRSLRRSLGLQR